MNPKAVRVHIERLVLEDWSGAERHGVAAAVETELARLLTEKGLPDGIGTKGLALRRVDGGTFARRPTDTARAAGARVADGVYRGLARAARRPS